MPDTEAMIGYGSKFLLEDDSSPPELVELAEVVNITPPNMQTAQVDATHMQSPNRMMEFIAGLTDPGSASFVMNFVPSSDSDARILAWRASGLRKQCQIIFPNAVTWTFNANCEGYQPEAAVADVMRATVTVKVTGSVTPGVDTP